MPKTEQQNGHTLLTIPEVAHALRVDDSTVRRWVRRGVLQAITLPRRGNRHIYRIKQGALDAVLHPV